MDDEKTKKLNNFANKVLEDLNKELTDDIDTIIKEVKDLTKNANTQI